MRWLVVILTILIVIVLRVWWHQSREESESQQPLEAQESPGFQQSCRLMPEKCNRITLKEILFAVLLLLVVDICSVVHFHMITCRADKKKLDAWDWYPISCSHPVLLTTFGERVDQWLNSGLFMLMLD